MYHEALRSAVGTHAAARAAAAAHTVDAVLHAADNAVTLASAYMRPTDAWHRVGGAPADEGAEQDGMQRDAVRPLGEVDGASQCADSSRPSSPPSSVSATPMGPVAMAAAAKGLPPRYSNGRMRTLAGRTPQPPAAPSAGPRATSAGAQAGGGPPPPGGMAPPVKRLARHGPPRAPATAPGDLLRHTAPAASAAPPPRTCAVCCDDMAGLMTPAVTGLLRSVANPASLEEVQTAARGALPNIFSGGVRGSVTVASRVAAAPHVLAVGSTGADGGRGGGSGVGGAVPPGVCVLSCGHVLHTACATALVAHAATPAPRAARGEGSEDRGGAAEPTRVACIRAANPRAALARPSVEVGVDVECPACRG